MPIGFASVLGGGDTHTATGGQEVAGPASSTDNAVVRWDGTAGNLVQNSVLIVADTTGALSGFTTGVGITFHGSGTITGASGALTLTPSGTESVTVASGGLLSTGGVAISSDLTSSFGTNQRFLAISNPDAITAGLFIANTANVSGVSLALAKTRSTGSDADTAVQTGDTFGMVRFYGADGTGYIESVRLSAVSTGTIGTNRMPSVFRIATSTDAAPSVLTTAVEISAAQGMTLTGNFTAQGTGTHTFGTTNTVTMAAGVLTVTGNVVMSASLIGGEQALSGAGAINVTQLHTSYTSTGAAQALTLANGTAGQIKTITHVVDGGSGILTPTTAIGYTTITFANVGDSVTLRYTAQGWSIIGIYGAIAA